VLEKPPSRWFVNPRVVEVRCRDFEAGWFRFAPQAPAFAETRPGYAGEIVTTMRLPKIRGAVEVPADADRMAISADTLPRKSRKYSRPDRGGWVGVFPCVREAAPPAPYLASGFAAWSRMAPRTAPLQLHSTPAISAAAAVNAHSGARVVRSPRSFLAHRPLGG
jgi:hypothetical protein